MRDKIAKIMTRFEGTAFYPYSSSVVEALSEEILFLIREEIEKSLLTKDEIERIWETGENQDPFVDFERVSQAQLDKILKALEV